MSTTKSRSVARLHALLFGGLLAGCCLFQGTGFISEAKADITENNVNVAVSTDSETAVNSPAHYTGLTGTDGSSTASTTGQITITDGAAAIVGILDTTTQTVTSIDPVQLTVTSTGTGSGVVTVGTNGDASVKTFLVVAGDMANASTLTMGDSSGNGTNLTLYDGGMLQIGLDAEAEDVGNGLGTVTIKNGSQLYNNGTHTTSVDHGILVTENGTLQLGNSADDLSSGSLLTGAGITTNSGKIVIYNETGTDNKAYFGIYADTSTGTMDATGTIAIHSGTHQTDSVEDGGITINGKIGSTTAPDTLSVDNSLYIASTGSVAVKNLELGTSATILSNAGTLQVTGSVTPGATTTTMTNTGKALFETLDLGTGVSYTNTTTADSTTQYTSITNLTVSGGKLENTKGSAVIGTMTLSDGTVTTSGGSTSVTTADVTGGTFTMSSGTATLATVNQSAGTLSISAGGTMTAANWNLSGTGVATVAAGTLTTSKSLAMTGGTITTAGGTTKLSNVTQSAGTISTTSGTTTITGLTLSDEGTVSATSGNLTITGLAQTGGTITNEGGTASLAGEISGGTINATSGTTTMSNLTASLATGSDTFLNISGAGLVRVTGDLEVTSGAIAINTSGTSSAAMTMTEGSDLAIDFASNANPVINLTAGRIDFDEGSTLSAADAASLAAGNYTRTLVAKNGTADEMAINFNSTLEDSLAFFDMAYVESDASADITLTVRDFSTFTANDNQREVAKNLDALRISSSINEPLRNLIEENIMYKAANAEEVQQAMQQLASTGRANSYMLAMDSCWNFAFNQLNQSRHKRITTVGNGMNYSPYRYFRGQMEEYGDVEYADGYENGYADDGTSWSDMTVGSLFSSNGRTPNNAWGTVYSTALQGLEDGNSDPYNMTRTGIALGYDATFCNGSRGGIMFSYSQPFLRSNRHHIDASNIQLGLYCEHDYSNDVNLKLFVAGGTQEYTSKRSVSIGGYNDYFRTVNNGNSVSAAAKLSKDCLVNCNSLFRVFGQVDSQTVWQDACSEGTGAAALDYDKGDWTRVFGRVGLESEVNAEFMQLSGRAVYGYQLNDATAPEMSAQFANVIDPTTNMTIYGVDLGRSYVDLGLGALGYLDCSRNWTISGNYDFVGSDNLRSHTGSVSLMYLF